MYLHLFHQASRDRQIIVCINGCTHRSHSALVDVEGQGSLLKDTCNPVLLGGLCSRATHLTSHEGVAHCTKILALSAHTEHPA